MKFSFGIRLYLRYFRVRELVAYIWPPWQPVTLATSFLAVYIIALGVLLFLCWEQLN